jgi:opacity protein-like surface antigen
MAMKKTRMAQGVAIFVLFLSWAALLLPSDQDADFVRVSVRFARVRVQPNAKARIVKELGYGTLLRVLGASGDYFRVAALNVPSDPGKESWYVLRGEVEAALPAAAQALLENRKITFTPASPAAGQSLLFTASNFRTPNLLRWDMGDGTVLTSGGTIPKGQEATLAYTYAEPGQYLVKVFDDRGDKDLPPVTVMVAVGAGTRSLQVNPDSPRANHPAILTARNFHTPEKVAWDMGDGTKIQPGTGPGVLKATFQISHTYKKTGTYIVKAYDDNGDTRQTPLTLLIKVAADPRRIRVEPEKAVAGTLLQFSAEEFTTPNHLCWDMGDGTILPSKNEPEVLVGSQVSYSYKAPGEYVVRVYDWGGDTGSQPVLLAIRVGAAASVKPAAALPARTETAQAAPVTVPAAETAASHGKKYPLIKIGPYAGYFRPQDMLLKQIYGEGDVIYGARLGVHIWNGFYAWLSASQYKIISKTTFTEDRTTLTLLSASAFLRYGLRLGFFQPYAGIGLTKMHFKEEAEIGNVTGDGSNTAYEGGFELRLNRHFYIDFSARYGVLKVNPTGFDIDLGGLQAGVALLVSF